MIRALGVVVAVALGGCQDPYGTVGGQPTARADPAKPVGKPTQAQPEAKQDANPEPAVKPPDDKPADPDAGPEPKPMRIAKSEAGVELLAPGAEPREVLALSPGGEETRNVVIEMTLGVFAGGKEVAPTVMPELHAVLTAKAQRDGEAITYAFSVSDASRKDVEGHAPTERVAAAVDQVVAGLKSAKGTISLTHRGAVTKFEFDAGGLAVPGLRPSLTAFQQLFAQLFPVLPADAIGVGARWKAVSHADLGGVPVQQEAMYSLVRRSGDTAELEVAFSQAATLEAGDDTEHGSRGTAKITVDRRRVAPIQATASSRTLRNFQVKTGEQPSAVKMDQALELSISAE